MPEGGCLPSVLLSSHLELLGSSGCSGQGLRDGGLLRLRLPLCFLLLKVTLEMKDISWIILKARRTLPLLETPCHRTSMAQYRKFLHPPQHKVPLGYLAHCLLGRVILLLSGSDRPRKSRIPGLAKSLKDICLLFTPCTFAIFPLSILRPMLTCFSE